VSDSNSKPCQILNLHFTNASACLPENQEDPRSRRHPAVVVLRDFDGKKRGFARKLSRYAFAERPILKAQAPLCGHYLSGPQEGLVARSGELRNRESIRMRLGFTLYLFALA
jgi:hypothetical protein